MGVPTFRANGTVVASSNNVNATTNLSPTKNASTVNGDLMLLISSTRSRTATHNTPSGWTLLTGFPVASATTSGGQITVLGRIADGSGSDAPTLTWSSLTNGTSGDSCQAFIQSWSGADDVQEGTVTSTDGTATTTWTAPAITTTGANDLALQISVKISDTAQTATTTNFTERLDSHTTTGTGHLLYVASLVPAGAGSTGTSTVTPSSTTSSQVIRATLSMAAAVTVVPLQQANAASTGSAGLMAATAIPLDSADAVSGADQASISTGGPVVLVPDAAAAVSGADLDLNAPTRVPLDPAGATSAAALTLSSAAPLAVDPAGAASAASNISLSARTAIPGMTAAATSTASNVALTARTTIPLGSAGGQSGASNAGLAIAVQAVVAEVAFVIPSSSVGLAIIPTDPAGATSTASNIDLSARTAIPTQSADAISAASMQLSAKTTIAAQAAAATSTASAALSARTTIATQAAAATSTAALTLTAATRIALQQADAQSGVGNAALTARTIVPLQVSAAVSTASNLALSAVPSIPIQAANAVSSAAALFSAKTAIPFQTSDAQSSAAAALRARTTIPFQAVAAQSTSSDLAIHVPHLVPISVPGFLTIEPYRTEDALDSAHSVLGVGAGKTGLELDPNESAAGGEDYESTGEMGAVTGSLRVDG